MLNHIFLNLLNFKGNKNKLYSLFFVSITSVFLINEAHAHCDSSVSQMNLHIINNMWYPVAIGFNEPGSQISTIAARSGQNGDEISEDNLCFNKNDYHQTWHLTAFLQAAPGNSGVSQLYDGSISIDCNSDVYRSNYCDDYSNFSVLPTPGYHNMIAVKLSFDQTNTPTITLSPKTPPDFVKNQ